MTSHRLMLDIQASSRAGRLVYAQPASELGLGPWGRPEFTEFVYSISASSLGASTSAGLAADHCLVENPRAELG
jgi:hypothetical protein